MIKINKAKLAGFTLIELTVSIAIIALMSGILLANINYSNKPGELNMAAQKLASDIRLTQSYALGLKNFMGSPPDGGWGIYAQENTNTYIIFADADVDKVYDAGEGLTEFSLPKGIIISNINAYDSDGSGGSLPGPNGQIHITFEPPNPIVHICRGNNNCDHEYDSDAEITLTVDSYQRFIKVNIFGLVDVEN